MNYPCCHIAFVLVTIRGYGSYWIVARVGIAYYLNSENIAWHGRKYIGTATSRKVASRTCAQLSAI